MLLFGEISTYLLLAYPPILLFIIAIGHFKVLICISIRLYVSRLFLDGFDIPAQPVLNILLSLGEAEVSKR
jgi:hypothetical protein